MTVIGCTGHQNLPLVADTYVSTGIASVIAESAGDITGVCSLALGADTLFARLVLDAGGELFVVVPSADYAETFPASARQDYLSLLSSASGNIVLPFKHASEAAFMSAGEAVVDRCDVLVAVWDGEPSRGLGGTADVVRYASEVNRPIRRIWPDGVRR